MCVYVVKIGMSTSFHSVVRSNSARSTELGRPCWSDQSPVFLHTLGISRCHNHPV